MKKFEWWMDSDKFWIRKGEWRIKEDVPAILAEHRKKIVKEIREEINNMELARNSPWAVEAVLSLPCLKENE